MPPERPKFLERLRGEITQHDVVAVLRQGGKARPGGHIRFKHWLSGESFRQTYLPPGQ